jgi:DNA processing protein
MTEQEALLVLNAVPNLGAIRIRKLLAYFGGAGGVLRAPFDELYRSHLLTADTAENIFHFSKDKFLQDEYNLMQHKGIVAVTSVDDNYPGLLNVYEDSPVVLYVKGGH